MVQIVLIGLGAGAAAALMFASAMSGAMLSIVLFYLAPLPIMIAALGWNHWAGLLASLIAAALLGFIFGLYFFAAFLAGIGVPAWWLGYLAMLGRPAPPGTGGHLEWYPPGRLILWAALLGALVVAVALVALGADEETIHAALRTAIAAMLPPEAAGEEVPPPGVIDLFASVMPPVAAVIAALVPPCNLWLAGHVVLLSGRLRRPWPDIATMSFPPAAAAALAVAVVLSFLPDIAGLMASLFAATLAIAFAILGFAVMHAATRGLAARRGILAGTYVLSAMMMWPVAIMALIGLAETLFHLRAGRGVGGPPVAPAA
jgi:hypothetical protein